MADKLKRRQSSASDSASERAQPKKRYGMVIDLDRCIGCWTCAVACKMENNIPSGLWWSRVLTVGADFTDTSAGEYPNLEKHYKPVSCFHCEKPACMQACKSGATYQREDGLVLIDYDKCTGCRECLTACPHNNRVFNWEEPDYAATEVEGYGAKEASQRRQGVAEKCTFCVHRVDQGLEPICVVVCPVQARSFGDLNDPEEQVTQMVRKANVSPFGTITSISLKKGLSF